MKHIILLFTLLFLSGCFSMFNDVELAPNKLPDTDELRISPCACAQLDFIPKKLKFNNAPGHKSGAVKNDYIGRFAGRGYGQYRYS